MHCTANNANMNTERPSSVFETVDIINIYASLSTELSSRSSNGSVVQCSAVGELSARWLGLCPHVGSMRFVA